MLTSVHATTACCLCCLEHGPDWTALCLPYAQLLEYPGRPSLSTLDNNTPNPKPGLLEYIPAVQTRPFNITSANSISSSADFTNSFETSSNSSGSTISAGGTKVGLAACWDEELCVDAAPEQLVESDALLLLELLQLPGGFARYQVSPDLPVLLVLYACGAMRAPHVSGHISGEHSGAGVSGLCL